MPQTRTLRRPPPRRLRYHGGVRLPRLACLVGLVLAALILATSSPSRADGGKARARDLARARAYFKAGTEAYDRGQYDVALSEFQHAHALTKNPILYFNMA